MELIPSKFNLLLEFASCHSDYVVQNFHDKVVDTFLSNRADGQQ